MLVKLNQILYEYLKENLFVERAYLFKSLNLISNNSNTTFEIDDNIAIEVRDWAGERLQKVGFAINYELTSEGRILEQIIDLFYS